MSTLEPQLFYVIGLVTFCGFWAHIFHVMSFPSTIWQLPTNSISTIVPVNENIQGIWSVYEKNREIGKLL